MPETHQPRTKLWEVKLWGLQHSLSHCNINVPAAWHWLQDWCIWSGHPHLQTQHPSLSSSSWCDTAPERCGSGAAAAAASRLGGPNNHFPTHEHVREQLLPFLGLSLVFSERCWPLSLQSAPSPNSTQPSCSVSVFGCGREGNKSNNDRMDRYGDRRGKIINVQWRNNGEEFN